MPGEIDLPLPDPGSLRRGRFTYFPVAPGRLEFAIEVRQAILRERPEVVAVELPATLQDAWMRAVRRLPTQYTRPDGRKRSPLQHSPFPQPRRACKLPMAFPGYAGVHFCTPARKEGLYDQTIDAPDTGRHISWLSPGPDPSST